MKLIKTLGSLLMILTSITPAIAGGTVHFSNKVLACDIDAPFFAADAITRLSGDDFLAELYAGTLPDQLKPVGPPVPFRSGPGAGYLATGESSVREIPDVAPGERALVQIRIWQAAAGATYEEALTAFGYTGTTEPIWVWTGGEGKPPSVPACLRGLQSTRLVDPVPAGARQATVRFSNRVPAVGLDAPVFHVDGSNRPAGEAYRAQLYAGTSPENLEPVGAPSPFGTGANAGYWTAENEGVIALAGLSPGDPAFVAVRVWAAAAGASYEQALARQGLTGTSETLSVLTGGSGVPPAAPTILAGLRSFRLTSPAVTARGPGTINVNNRLLAAGINAPVFHLDGRTRLDATHRAQLYAGPSADDLLPIGDSFVFRNGDGAGYLDPKANTIRSLPHVPAGATAFVQLRAWDPTFGATYEEALAINGPAGTSETLAIETGGGGQPPSVPANLVGLRSFSLKGAPLFLAQPQGGTFFAGRARTMQARLMTAEPVALQWERDGADLPGENALALDLGPLQTRHSGVYRLRATHDGLTTISQPSSLSVLSVPTEACVLFVNRWDGAGLDAPVRWWSANGGEPLHESSYVAQLYAGRTADALRPVGETAPFGAPAEAGYWNPGSKPWRVLEGFLPGERAFVQVRVWMRSGSESYEAAVAKGNLVGVSEIMEVVTGGGPAEPTVLAGLRSFELGVAARLLRVSSGDRLLQPGQSLALESEAAGDPTILYQWFFNDHAVPGATAPRLTLNPVDAPDAGEYRVKVQNRFGGSVGQSLRLTVTDVASGGLFRFSNRSPGLDRPVQQTDTLGRNTRLVGSDYRVELLVGPTPNALRPIGEPAIFSSDAKRAGYWEASPVERVAANVAPGVEAFCQLRAWNSAAGATYEEARANGGSNGKTPTFTAFAGGQGAPPKPATTLSTMPTLVLHQPPILTWPTGDLVVEVGRTFWIDITVKASYTLMTKLSWQFQAAGRTDWTASPGATGSRLRFPSATKKQEGLYRVIAESVAGTTVSPPLRLYVAARVPIGKPGWQALRLELTETVDGLCRIEASTNLVNWRPLYQTNQPPAVIEFSDPMAKTLPQRFYRARNATTGKVVSKATVGFVQLVIPHGFAMRSNTLLTGDDTVGSILAGLPESIMIYKYDPEQGYRMNSLLDGAWEAPGESLAPGEAFITRSTAIDTQVVTVAGRVPEGLHSRQLPRGWSLLACPVPIGGRVDATLRLPLRRDDNVDLLNPETYDFDAYVFDGQGGWYSGTPLRLGPAPEVAVGEGFWFYTEEAKTWDFEYRSDR